MTHDNIKGIAKVMSRLVPRPAVNFSIGIVAHCNLNCKGCGVYSPLADKEFISLDEYVNDIRRMSILAEGVCHHISILGGEPLLHPELNSILKVTRELFPIGQIFCVTNGILLGKMTNEFWETCRNNRITLGVTIYPIDVDYESLKQMAKDNGVRMVIYAEASRDWIHMRLGGGERNECESFLLCNNYVPYMWHGKFYSCAKTAHVDRFNKYFERNYPVTKKDYVDIYEANSIEEILEFAAKPVPFCRFCNPEDEGPAEWGYSKREIKEWL